MPSPAVRRPVTVIAWLVISILFLALSPVLLAVAALAAAATKRPQPLLLTRLLVTYFARELGVLAACGALWVLSGAGARIGSKRFQDLHYRLLEWFIHGLTARALALLDIRVASEIEPDAASALQRDRPLLFFSRHAGPGDTALLIDLLLTHYRRRPSVVFKETLAIDPCVDLLGHRLPHAVLDADNREKCEATIRQITAELGDRGVLVLFPEGANFTFERRMFSLRKLSRKGRRREAAEGGQMAHVMPPHPTGALVALNANPTADVIFGAHTGLGLAAFPRELWRDTPIGATFTSRMWLVPADQRPTDPDEQVRWIYDWWTRIDDWIDQASSEPSAPRVAVRRPAA
jgi:1-acyl-sn-glycerol-3-phosphate acyltransferase